MKKIMQLLLKLLITLKVVWGQTGDQAKSLREQLFITNNYDKKIRPVADQSQPIVAYTQFHLLSINGLDEVSETLKTTGYLEVRWYDSYLFWNKTEYGGLWYYLFPQDDIWKPDIALKNSVGKYQPLGDDKLNLFVDADGHVIWNPFEVFQSTCSVDIKHFPFDVQTCTLYFIAWSYYKAEVLVMHFGDEAVFLDEFQSNSEWDLIDSSVAENVDNQRAGLIFTLKLKRKPLYTILTVISPIWMLSILNIFVFMLPCDSGEKASYAVTVFLAFAVFLSIISSSLPTNSESISIMSIYIVILTFQSTIITMIALTVIRVRQFESPVPGVIVWFSDTMHFRCHKRKEKTKVVPITVDSHEENSIEAFRFGEGQQNGRNANNNREVRNNKTGIAGEMSITLTQEKDEGNGHINEAVCDWKTVTNALDRFLFCFFAMNTLVSSLVCYLYASTGSI